MLNWQLIREIVSKDIEEFRKSKFVFSSLVGLPLLLAIVIPIITLYPFTDPTYASSINETDIRLIREYLGLQSNLNGQQVIFLFTLNTLSTFFMVIPAVIPTVIASHSLVGEKINRTLEPLLATPLKDVELLIGKILSAFIPTMFATYFAFTIFIVFVNYLAYPIFNYILIPDIRWTIIIGVLAPLFCLLSITTNVLISSKVNDVRSAQQIGGLIVVPLILIIIFSTMGIVVLDIYLLILIGTLLGILNIIMGYVALKLFRRDTILTEWK